MANILFVVADKDNPTTGEAYLKATVLEGAGGHVVTYASDEDAEVLQDAYDCAILSDSCNFGTSLTGKYQANWSKGVIVGGAGWVFRNLTGTLSAITRDQLAINSLQAGHALAAGLTSPVTVFSVASALNYSTSVGSDADLVFKLTTSASYAIFAYEDGDALVGGAPAPGRRVGMGLKEASWPSLTAGGQTIWLNAVDWASTVPNTPPVIAITEKTSIGGTIYLPVGATLQLNAVITDPDPDDANLSPTWDSDTPAAATVGTDGLVTAVAEGTSVVTASTIDTAEATGEDSVTIVVANTPSAGGATSPYLIARAAVAPLGGF